jgi:hypothetical protein
LAGRSDAKIVEFWQIVEMFSPQDVGKPDATKWHSVVRAGEPLPWEDGHKLKSRRLKDDRVWRHTVYLGTYGLAAVFDTLKHVFEPDEESFDRRPHGKSAVAAFVVDGKGHAVRETEVLSTCAWGLGQVLRDKNNVRDWLSLFEKAAAAFGRALEEITSEDLPDVAGDGAPVLPEPVVLDHGTLGRCLAAAVRGTGVPPGLGAVDILVESVVISRTTAGKPATHDFLNSFIVDDLHKVAGEAAKGRLGAALRTYLRPEDKVPVHKRVDVLSRLDVVMAQTAPAAVSAGRWPTRPAHPLALSQQLAVSTAAGMTGAGLLGVNGPPGTGKTTMLRDLVAALVVERAGRLAALSTPAAAFTGKKLEWRTNQYRRTINPLRKELTGFEVVVASSNNTAVQNITDEIPAAGAIDESWHEQAAAVDYFTDIASELLSPGDDAPGAPEDKPGKPDKPGERAWGLVAARLGNKANRSRFTSAFWYRKPADDEVEPWYGMKLLLDRYALQPPEQPWSAAVACFRAAESRVTAIRDARSRTYGDVQRRDRLVTALAEHRQAVAVAAARVGAAKEERAAAVRAVADETAVADGIARERQRQQTEAAVARKADAERVVAEQSALVNRIRDGRKANAERAVAAREVERATHWQRRADHQAARPTFWARLTTFGAAGERWRHQDRWLADEIEVAAKQLLAAQREVNLAQDELDAAQTAVDTALDSLSSARRLLDEGVPLPTVTHEPLDRARARVTAADKAVTKALRAENTAEEAVRTTTAELTAVDKQLADAAAALGSAFPDQTWWTDRERRELSALWTDEEWNQARSAHFLAALALHKEFLRHTAKQTGQNLRAAMDVVEGTAPKDAPEEAALAAWQSLFLVVPVVSTTFASFSRLFGHLGREALGWLLVDEAGQAAPQQAVGALWRSRRAVAVGDPLQLEPIVTVPFRAEQAIRNDLGVDVQWSATRTSVQRLADRQTALGTWLPDGEERAWVGVPLTVHRRCDQPMFHIVNSVVYDGLMIDGTGTAAGTAFAGTYPTLPPSKWIDVAGGDANGHWNPAEGQQLDRILRTLATLEFDMTEVLAIGPFKAVADQLRRRSRQHPGLVAGTVHTAQGKQADVVILVLGSDPRSHGSRQWASSKPNLLNVAVSRAKRRLYVIGDVKAWSRWPYFSTLAASLPHTPPLP